MQRGTFGFPFPTGKNTLVPIQANTAPYSGAAGAVPGFIGIFGGGFVQTFSSAGTFTVPTGISKLRVRSWGAGGSGATSSADVGGPCGATGGAGGGFSLKVFDVTAGQTFAVTVGTGATTPNSINSQNNGTAGGTSSFGSVLSATGGAGGTATQTNAVTLTGAVGGVGVGGDVNLSGGNSGTITAIPNGSYWATGGGGAASQAGPGGVSGSCSGTGQWGGTGGGGIGGNRSPSLTANGSNGGAGASGSSTLLGGPDVVGVQSSGAGSVNTTNTAGRFFGELFTSGGGAGGGTGYGGGALGGAGGGAGQNGTAGAGSGGNFAGGGAAACSATGGYTATPGSGGIGAGSGGAACKGGNAYGAKAGDGFVVVEY